MKIDMVIKNQLFTTKNQNATWETSGIMQENDNRKDESLKTLPYNDDQHTIRRGWSATTPSYDAALQLSLSSLSSRRRDTPEETKATLFSSPGKSTTAFLSCLRDCACRCHFRSIIRSPRLLSNFLGDIMLGFSNLPWAVSGFSQCDEQTCRRMRYPETEVKYILPSWFGNAVASFRVDFAIRFLPLNIHIHTLNTIPYDSPILVCTQEGNLEGIMKLLQSGGASLYDVDPYGLGLLYVSYCSTSTSAAYIH
jgi:hypothetical protein